MRITASALRANIYKLLDRVIESGTPIVIERKGKELKISPVEPPAKLSRLVARPDFLTVDPDALIHVDWSHEWKF